LRTVSDGTCCSRILWLSGFLEHSTFLSSTGAWHFDQPRNRQRTLSAQTAARSTGPSRSRSSYVTLPVAGHLLFRPYFPQESHEQANVRRDIPSTLHSTRKWRPKAVRQN